MNAATVRGATRREEEPATAAFARRLERVAAGLLALALAVNVAASFELRGLHADGAYFLMRLLETHRFCLLEPSRRTVAVLQQTPTVIALNLGLGSLHAIEVLFSLTVHLLPLLLVASCLLILPRDRKAWLLFPLLHYFAGSSAALFSASVEGLVAAAYIWPLLFSILFRTGTKLGLLCTLAFALPTLYLHEAMAFLGPVLAVAATLRATSAPQKWQRAALWMLAAWMIAVAAVQLSFVIDPRSPQNRSSYFDDLLRLRWLRAPWGDTNVPAFLGLLAIVVMFAAAGRWSSLAVRAFGVICLSAVAASIYVGDFVAPGAQFRARNVAALLSLPLAVLALASLRSASLRALWARLPNVTILFWLAVGTLGWHAVATFYWATYLDTFRQRLDESRGLVSWEEALRSLPAERRSLFERMSWAWTTPSMSLLLARDGKVLSIIANPTSNRWQPFDPSDAASLPKSNLLDTSAYREHLSRR